MFTGIDRLMEKGCERDRKEKLCRARGGESCAFDGAMIVLQPIADTAHIVHGPIACCGNSWEGRGTLSSKGGLHRMGFTTDMTEMDIVYGSSEKLLNAIIRTCEKVRPKAVFVHATCVSGLIGEDIESVCKEAEERLRSIRVIPVNAPGFVGPKNLGNRIAGEVLLDSVIGTGEPLSVGENSINLIGEYNIAGDLWLVEPVLKEAGINILSKITGDSTFEEITHAHRAQLNVVVCSRALINVAREMERKYGIPYVEVSFFGKTEMSKALRTMAERLNDSRLEARVEEVIAREENRLSEKLREYEWLRGKRAVLYTGGVKSWSFISALLDLGIEVAAVGTKKSTFEDEEKMRAILGEGAPLVEDVTPKNLLRLMRDNHADILVAGGRNLYLAVKEGFPFVDVNQERHVPFAGYDGLLNLAREISGSIRFYKGNAAPPSTNPAVEKADLSINPLKHSQSVGAVIAFQGVHRALPVIHGAQGCSFLSKVLITKHFREPIALQSTKLFTEDVVMGSDEKLLGVLEGIVEKQSPDVIGVLTSGLSEVKGDDLTASVKGLRNVVHVPTPDYEGSLETGYAKAVTALIGLVEDRPFKHPERGLVNVLAGSHLTPADFRELRGIIESFGLMPIMLPDLSALDGSRQGFSGLAEGGTRIEEIKKMARAGFTIAVGMSMEEPARALKERFGTEYRVFGSVAGLRDTDEFMETLSLLGGRPSRHERQRRVLIDSMRDAHFYYAHRKVCLALEPDLSVQTSRWLVEMGASVELSVIPAYSEPARSIQAKKVVVGDLSAAEGDFDLLISNSHAEDAARRLGVPLYQAGFPVYKVLGNNSRLTIGYRGTLMGVHEVGNRLMEVHR